MAIPETQLETWSKFVPSQISKTTADSIRDTLESMDSDVYTKRFEVYLQGSYRNRTNLRGDSDVDLVIELKSTFASNASSLPMGQNRLYHQTFSDATYHLDDFRRDVIRTLQRRYSTAKVDTNGNKAIRVIGYPGSRLDADILVCQQYRRYTYFYSSEHSRFVEGIKFWTQREHLPTINFPKVHFQNGCEKHDASNQWFKKTVRTMKHARNRIVDKGWMDAEVAPSYFIESLVYNLPDHRFGGSFQMNYDDVLTWLEAADLTAFRCQNRQLPLFGTDRVQWNMPHARRYLSELRDLWKLWG